jgi:hypothetical protein
MKTVDPASVSAVTYFRYDTNLLSNAIKYIERTARKT